MGLCSKKKESKAKRSKTDMNDQPAIAWHLDEQVVEYFTNDLALEENNYENNWKLVFGAIATGLACLAQLFPLPFPESYPYICCCVGIYYVIQAVLGYMQYFVHPGAILVTYEKKKSKGDKGMKALSVSTNMDRASTDYKLTIGSADGTGVTYDEVWDIQELFDVEGHFLADIFSSKMKVFWKGYQRKAE